MSQRTLLLVALGLMAAGLLLGTVNAIVGGATSQESRQVQGPQEGPNGQGAGPGGFVPGRGTFGGGSEPGEGALPRHPRFVNPSPKSTTPSPTATP